MEWTHHGRKVTVTEAGLFQAEGLSFAFSTLEDARKAIEKDIKDIIGGLSLPVILADGSPNTLTGIHGGHGGFLLTSKSTDRYDALTIYPAHPTITKLIEERKALGQAQRQITDRLAPLQLMYFKTRAAAAPDRNATAQADYDTKLAAAKALADRM